MAEEKVAYTITVVLQCDWVTVFNLIGGKILNNIADFVFSQKMPDS